MKCVSEWTTLVERVDDPDGDNVGVTETLAVRTCEGESERAADKVTEIKRDVESNALDETDEDADALKEGMMVDDIVLMDVTDDVREDVSEEMLVGVAVRDDECVDNLLLLSDAVLDEERADVSVAVGDLPEVVVPLWDKDTDRLKDCVGNSGLLWVSLSIKEKLTVDVNIEECEPDVKVENMNVLELVASDDDVIELLLDVVELDDTDGV